MADIKERTRTTAAGTASARTLDMKLEVVVIPVSDVDRAKEFLRRLGWRLDADFAGRRRLPGDPVHAARLRVLDHLRQERHRGGTRLRPGPVPDRLRHRGRPQRTARPRRQDQRGVPRRRRRVRRHRTSPICLGGSGSAVRIPSIAATARSPRSAIRTATAGCSRRSPRDCPDAWTRRTRPSPRRRSSRPRFDAPRPRMGAREADRAGTTRTGRTGTPSTWSASRPARSCRHERRRGPAITAITIGRPSPPSSGIDLRRCGCACVRSGCRFVVLRSNSRRDERCWP